MPRKVLLDPFPGKIAVRVWSTRLTDAGIILLKDPANSRVGTVVAVYDPYIFSDSDGKEVEPFVQVGDHVVFGRHSGVEVTIERETFIILKESEGLTKLRFVEEEEQDATVNS
jgi:co-chaperonin GroES (HSP10)